MSDLADKSSLGPSAPARAAPATDATARNARLQYLRGFAAIAVLLFHVSSYINQLRGDGRFLDIFSAYWGAYGVAAFFVLSGYLMAGLSERGSGARFLSDRILRIYPPFLIAFAVTALAYFVTGFGRRPDLVAMTLIPAGQRDYMLGVEWTLLFEMTYYVVIALAMMTDLRRHLGIAFALWLTALAAIELAGLAPAPTATPTLTQLFGQNTNAAFLMGFLLPAALKRFGLPPSWLLAVLAVPIGAIGFFLPETLFRWPAGASATLLVAAAVTARRGAAAGPLHRVGLALGDASYALYLIHVPLIVVTSNILPARVPTAALWIGWTAAALALGLFYGRIDIGIHQRLKLWSSRLAPQHIARGAYVALAVFLLIGGVADVQTRAVERAATKAQAALRHNPPAAVPGLLAGIDSAAVLGDGKAILRGYGIDPAKPDDDSHIAIEQNGQLIGFDRMRRMRPREAREAGRPDLASIRFGFGVVTQDRLDCGKGPLVAKLILSDGRVATIPPESWTSPCPAAPR